MSPILENANTDQQPATTTNPITTVITNHLNHNRREKINKSQPPITAHSATTTHKPIQPPSHPKNPDREGTKNPLTLSNSKSKILATVFLDLKLDPSNEQRSGSGSDLGPLAATSPTTKQVEIWWWCHQNGGKERQRVLAKWSEEWRASGCCRWFGQVWEWMSKVWERGRKSRVWGCVIFVKCFILFFW